MAKQRIRNKNVQAFMGWVATQPPNKAINNTSWELCAVGKFMPTIGLSLKGLKKLSTDFWKTFGRSAFHLHHDLFTQQLPDVKFIDQLERASPLLYRILSSKNNSPKTYGELDLFIKDNFTK